MRPTFGTKIASYMYTHFLWAHYAILASLLDICKESVNFFSFEPQVYGIP